MSDTTGLVLVAAVVGGAVLVALVVWFVAGRRGGDAGVLELTVRVRQLAETSQVVHDQLTRRLQEQERVLHEQLARVSERLSETLSKVSDKSEAQLSDLKARLAAIDAAQKNIADLSSQVVGLQDILADTKARGTFGEMMMQEVVRDLLPAPLYDFEVTLSNRQRVDCLLRLPPPLGPVGIDSKFPVQVYKALREAADEAASAANRRAFVQAVRKQVKDIADKYILPGETVDAAFMFVPSEAIFAELHANHLDVVQEAHRSRVFIVSPTTLWAVLNTVRAVMKDVRMREQAHIIQAEVLKMLEDVKRLDARVENLQKHFRQATVDIDEIRTSTDKILHRGDKVEQIHLEDAAAPDEPTVLPLDEHRERRGV